MPKPDPSITAHLEWLGFVRPTGLVVSAPALARHDATLNRRDVEGQRRLQACVEERRINGGATPQPVLPDFRAFAANVLDWRFSLKGYAGTSEAPIPPELEVHLPDTGEVLYALDCFETFPFPTDWATRPDLESPGNAYYDYRATLMVNNNEGLTKTYNRFHDPNEDSPAIAKLRNLHAAMDRAVLNAYGWQDIPTDCEFLLDYEIDESEWGTKKKPYRYRWPNEVLARLLELNAERAAQEARS